MARSTDGGASWKNRPVGDEQFLPVGALGDYLGNCARDGRVLPLWSDLRTDPVTAYTSPLMFDIHPPIVACPEPLLVEGSASGGAPASNPEIAVFLDSAVAQDDTDPDPTIVNDAPGFFPLGTTLVTFTATDDGGNTARCSAPLTVVDTTPPDLRVQASETVLTPANHRMVPITVTAEVADVCDPGAGFVLVSIVSSEPGEGLGRGDPPKDVQGADLGTADTRFLLRAESFAPEGRTYTIEYAAEDASGNVQTRVLHVRVEP
jgi:hypothetical protein